MGEWTGGGVTHLGMSISASLQIAHARWSRVSRRREALAGALVPFVIEKCERQRPHP